MCFHLGIPRRVCSKLGTSIRTNNSSKLKNIYSAQFHILQHIFFEDLGPHTID